MSRSGYVDSDGCDDTYDFLRMCGWQANVRRCLGGRAGQKFLWELYLALEALPEHALITGSLVDIEGSYCSLGAVARFRGLEIPVELRETADGEPDDDSDFYEAVTPLLDIKELLAREIMYQNDEEDRSHSTGIMERHSYGPRGDFWYSEVRRTDTPEERWQRMRRWVVSQLREIP